jgi:chemotaxis protein CheD
LVTYALGSCIALTIYDPVPRVGGMLHFMLPESDLHRGKAIENPYMFADSGIPLLFKRAFHQGADKKRLIVRATGGAQVMSDQEVFNIGKRNYLALRKILWKAGVMIHAEAIGGTVSRTVRLDVGNGRFTVREAAGPEMELVAAKHGNSPVGMRGGT